MHSRSLYTVTACRQSVLLRLDRHRSGWILDVPVLRLRLGQLAEQRALARRL